MARAMTAWWTGPDMGPADRAAELLARWRPQVERRARWYQRRYPGEVDWEFVAWDAAYRAAFRLGPEDGPSGFWALFSKILWRRAAHQIARRRRRLDKLRRVAGFDLDSLPFGDITVVRPRHT